ncbi:hypothetical protein KVR01_002705 [Diaporthe batatas]|uniref:uncharacterized protein n=1 Tax=Diaporthe batatas TaxID=748121 RepID=UPI001D04F2A6|nr:uncharacterized protein KVR01_002705 [Diaporthe batatas]KAG8167016.1 hypothetical protein KVR01_002705 [Diaporthe batatas]
MLLPSAHLSRRLAIAGLLLLALLCLAYPREDVHSRDSRVYSSPALAHQPGEVGLVVKRTWESEQGPFPAGPREGGAEDERIVTETAVSAGLSTERLGIPGLGNPLPPLGASVVGGSAAAAPLPGLPTPPIASADLFSSVISILAGAPTVAPASPGEAGGALEGLLSVLSQVSPLPAGTTVPPVVPTGSGGLIPAVDVLGGVAVALDHVLGSSSGGGSLDGGVLDQLSADIVAPFASIAADPASVLANPSAALDDLQGRVSSFLGCLPSAVAVGVQLASNVGGQIADALNATTEVLDSVPDVAAGVADKIGFLLNAAPNLATGLPAAALSAVNQLGSVLDADPDLVGDPNGTLSGLKKELSSALVDARSGVTSLAAAAGAHVVGVLPPVLQGPVQDVLSRLQNDVGGPLCQVSDVVGGTAIIFNVPCGSDDPLTSGLGAMTTATAPATASASITVEVASPSSPTSAPSSRPPLTSILSSLVSSLTSAGMTDADGVDPAVVPALSGLSSLFNQISALSLTATTTPLTPLSPPTVPLLPSTFCDQVAKTTIYHIQTITALITSTEVHVSTVTRFPAGLSSGGLSGSPPASLPPSAGLAPSTPGADVEGPCPGRGYTCDDCLDGWFCPPVQTPAWPAPCGHGWPCYQCESGWFCVPSDTATPTSSANAPAESIVFPTPHHPATERYQYAGCYADDPNRVLSKAETLDVRRGMTNEACIGFCQRQGFTLAGTEDGEQCFCGHVLIGSALLRPTHCDTPCTGDLSNSTVCGGPWALSVWGQGGIARQEPRPILIPGVFSHGSNEERASLVSEMITAVSDRAPPTATGEELGPDSSDVPLGLGEPVPGNSTMAQSRSGNIDGLRAERGGKDLATGSEKRSWGPRGKARWS